MKKLIATHNKSFHADEVTAIALLKLFEEDEIVVERIDHNTTGLATNYRLCNFSIKSKVCIYMKIILSNHNLQNP